MIAAASDLSPLEAKLKRLAQDSGITIRFVLGSSGQLAQQIRHGAPFDVYLSANKRYVTDLEYTASLLPGSTVVYARGRLALWSKGGRLKSLSDLGLPHVKKIAIANPAHAPYGVAAREVLEKAGQWARLQPKIVYGENVRQALQFAESGNAEVALIAWSLVKDRGAALIPETEHSPILQAGGVVANSKNRDASSRFLRLLASPDGRKLLEHAGFSPP